MKFSEYSLFVKSLIVGWIVFTAFVAIVVVFAKPIKAETERPQSQTPPESEASHKLLDKTKQNNRPTITLDNVEMRGASQSSIENNIPNAQVIMESSKIIDSKIGIKSNAPNTQVIMNKSEIKAKDIGIDLHSPKSKDSNNNE